VLDDQLAAAVEQVSQTDFAVRAPSWTPLLEMVVADRIGDPKSNRAIEVISHASRSAAPPVLPAFRGLHEQG